MKEIPLNHGKVAIVDDEDYALVMAGNKWHDKMYPCGHWYAQRTDNMRQCTEFMHRLIMNAPKGRHVDHINGNGLDNRRSNLRLATSSQNQMNRGAPKNNTTGYKGVHRSQTKGKWIAVIKARSKPHYLGTFKTPQSASEAYNRAAKELHGEFAPDPQERSQ